LVAVVRFELTLYEF